MTTPSYFQTDRKPSKAEQDDAASRLPAGGKRELTDAEIAAVAGGVSGSPSQLSERKH